MSDPKNNHSEMSFTQKTKFNIDVTAGLLTGIVVAGIFSPIDRALYRSIKDGLPFFSKENFKNPYQGFLQAIIQRAFLGGIYYISQRELDQHLYPYLKNEELPTSELFAKFCVGSLAGITSGTLTNSISVIKHHTWGTEGGSFFSSIPQLWTTRGIHFPFLGIQATIGRDMTFGIVYETLRHFLKNTFIQTGDANDKTLSFILNCISAGFATIASSPFNYARAKQYSTPADENTPSITTTWKNLRKEATLGSMRGSKIGFYAQRLGVGPGTFRVAAGMGLGQLIFDTTCDWLSPKLK